jgi:ABC-type phosphate transport system permease subunit
VGGHPATAPGPPVVPARTRATARAASDRPAELVLGGLSVVVLLLIGGMVVYVFAKAWPSFSHNGLAWFGSGGDANQQMIDIFNSPADPKKYAYTLHAWPLLYSTALVTLWAVFWGVCFSVFAAVFIVEFAPPRVRRIVEPVVRLLAAVPSVVYGLIGILVVVPFVAKLISNDRKESVAHVIQLNGESLIVAVAILTLMISPIMIAIVADALRAVPGGWTEGAAALGVNRWRVMWTISLRVVRPAIIAAAVLATARALGEAIMLAMVSGGTIFAPNPLDGTTFPFEPTLALAPSIVQNAEGLSVVPFGQTIYAFAAILLISGVFLSFAGWAAKQPLRKYGVR